MTKREYAEQIVNMIGGEVIEVEKANGLVFTGINRRTEGSNIAPTVYIDNMYDTNMDVTLAAQKVDGILIQHQTVQIDVNDLSDWNTTKSKLRARLYNSSTHADIKRSAKAYGFNDLIIIPYVTIDSERGMYCKVSKGLAEQWGVTARTILDTAIKNSREEIEIISMNVILREIMGPMADMTLGEDNIPMQVISNKSRYFGAIGAVLAREQLQEMFPNGYIILPSSVHEVIAIPNDLDAKYEMLTQIVQEVNSTQVSPEERLGDRAYTIAA